MKVARDSPRPICTQWQVTFLFLFSMDDSPLTATYTAPFVVGADCELIIGVLDECHVSQATVW